MTADDRAPDGLRRHRMRCDPCEAARTVAGCWLVMGGHCTLVQCEICGHEPDRPPDQTGGPRPDRFDRVKHRPGRPVESPARHDGGARDTSECPMRIRIILAAPSIVWSWPIDGRKRREWTRGLSSSRWSLVRCEEGKKGPPSELRGRGDKSPRNDGESNDCWRRARRIGWPSRSGKIAGSP
jgi:hypothetical protein